MQITMGGNPITLVGDLKKVGDKAPNFKALNTELKEVLLEEMKGKVIVLTSFPSVDTGICAMQVIKFNQEIAKLKDDVTLITLSNDLPFALKRYCGTNGIENALTLSDYRDLEFANNYGTLIKELRLLARTVFVIDKEGIIRYAEICSEIKSEVNFEKTLEIVKELI